MATELEIANQALYRVGSEPILTFPDLTNERGRVVSAAWPFVREAVLRAHSWNGATARAQPIRFHPVPAFGFKYSYPIPADCMRVLEVQLDRKVQWRVEGDRILTDGVSGDQTLQAAFAFNGAPTAADPVVCSSSATPSVLVNGDIVYITESDMTEINERNFRVANISGDTFELENEDGTLRTTGITGGQFQKVLAGDLDIRYVRNLDTDAELALADSELTHAFAVRLAAEICEPITHSTTKRDSLNAEFEKMLAKAKGDDGEEQSDSEFKEDDWILVRR